jgi:hypothetical protein
LFEFGEVGRGRREKDEVGKADKISSPRGACIITGLFFVVDEGKSFYGLMEQIRYIVLGFNQRFFCCR